MANVIDPASITPKRAGAQPKYPWSDWTDGRWWGAVAGTDYTSTTESFRTALYYHARRYGYEVSTRMTDDGMAFQFTRTARRDSSE